MCRNLLSRFLISVGLLALLCQATHLHAQSEGTATPSVRATYFWADAAIGNMSVQDAYLSPLTYKGRSYSAYLGMEVPFTKKLPLLFMPQASFTFAQTINPTYSAAIHFYRVEAQLDAFYRYDLPYNLKLALGAGLRTTFGSKLHSSNVNNPATIDALASLTANFMIAYMVPCTYFPATISFYNSINLLGMGHRVGYGQSYFEKEYLDGGLYKAFHFTHLGNARYFIGNLAVDLPVWNYITLRVGYRFFSDYSLLSKRINYNFHNSFFVGLSFQTLWFTGRKAVLKKELRPALFP